MIAYKKVVTVKDPDRMVLSGLPFRAGQRVEIVMIAEEPSKPVPAKALRKTLRATQRLPASRAVSAKQIAEEVAAYRVGR